MDNGGREMVPGYRGSSSVLSSGNRNGKVLRMAACGGMGVEKENVLVAPGRFVGRA